ncbi:hypothetical protein BH11CYA1_BH11CYA1_10700 [soil metagenome]
MAWFFGNSLVTGMERSTSKATTWSQFWLAVFTAYFFASALLLFLSSLALLPYCYLFDRNRRLLSSLACLWGYHFVRLNPGWRCHFDGLSNFRRGETYIIVANHQSIADVFILSGLGQSFKWVSKESLFKLPFFGWNMYLKKDIAIQRGDMSSIKAMLATCTEWLKKGETILMFPEGTRSETGEIIAFRDGSFRLAVQNNIAILPVVLNGTREILPKQDPQLKMSARVDVKILAPIYPEQCGNSAPELKRYVQNLMKETLAEMRLPVGETSNSVNV